MARTQPDPLARAAIEAGIGGDNGVPTARLSLLALLAQVKGGGLEAYWTDSEVYRCRGGNQQLAERLADAIGRERIHLRTPVVSVAARGAVGRVVAADGRTFEADRIVLAVPPSVLAGIHVDFPLVASLVPQMGSNVKHLSRVKSRFWEAQERSAYTLSDGDVNWTWESTDGQSAEGPAGLTAFCGGEGAERVRARAPAEREAAMAGLLAAWFPGYREAVEGTRFMDWPSDPWTRAAYSAWAPGEITRIGPALERGLGRLSFAGEHLSFAYMGYMEGALHSGVSLARRLAVRDGLAAAAPETR
jgi:monoamine oxidase